MKLSNRSQQALQSYLDALLQEALPEPEEAPQASPAAVRAVPAAPESSVSLDDFAAAVLEEEVRDARRVPASVLQLPERAPLPLREALPLPNLTPSLVAVAVPAVEPEPVALAPAPVPEVAPPQQVPVEPSVEALAVAAEPPPTRSWSERPEWAEGPFECLLFDVAGLTLAVPLVSLGTIYPLAGQELTPLFGQPDWFLGLLPSHGGNLKVIDTARWVMPERYRDDCREGLQYVISIEGCEWGLAVHQVNRSIRLDPREVKWRSQRSQRPWLAGTVIEHMCALLDVAALAELIAASGRRSPKV